MLSFANGALYSFFVSSGEPADTPVQVSSQGSVPASGSVSGSIDYDIEMPFDELEPFSGHPRSPCASSCGPTVYHGFLKLRGFKPGISFCGSGVW